MIQPLGVSCIRKSELSFEKKKTDNNRRFLPINTRTIIYFVPVQEAVTPVHDLLSVHTRVLLPESSWPSCKDCIKQLIVSVNKQQ